MTKISRLWGILGSLLVGVGLAQTAHAANPPRAATTYPIRAIQVTPARVYQTKRQTGVGYHLTVLPVQRAQLRVNLHIIHRPSGRELNKLTSIVTVSGNATITCITLLIRVAGLRRPT